MGHKVLLADDSITVQKIVKLSLSEEGIEVIAFGNGEQAVAQIDSIQPDLVMADVFMPGKDGYEVCEYVKAHPQLKHTPVILLVHAFEPFDPERAKKAGADHQLTKPFQSIRTLVTTVQDLLKSSATPAAETPLPTVAAAPLEAMPEPMPTMPQSMMAQSAEEFAVVSSLPASSPSEDLFSPQPRPSMPEVIMPTLMMTPPPDVVSPSAPITVGESALPGPPPISGGLVGAADMMPPLELPTMPQVSFEPLAETPPPISMPVMATPMSLSVDAPVMSPAAPSLMPMSTMPMVEMGDDDLLEIPDMMPVPVTQPLAQVAAPVMPMNQTTLDMPVLASLSATPLPTPVEAPGAFSSGVDMGLGKIDLSGAMNTAPINFEQDVKVGDVAPQHSSGEMQLSEAMIEEIVNRVVQRLSNKAIQEIAWEVVPEMAEMMIRQQMAQQPQLSH